jgi:Flp pilus assembly pilin Flp
LAYGWLRRGDRRFFVLDPGVWNMECRLSQLASIRGDRRGVTALEYGLIAAAGAAVGLAGFGALEGSLSSEFSKVSNSFADEP